KYPEDGSPQGGTVIHPPFVDPDPDYPTQKTAISTPRLPGTIFVPDVDEGYWDSYIFVYSEDPGDTHNYQNAIDSSHSTTTFEDTSRMKAGMYDPSRGEALQFDTLLAGVRQDKSYATWAGMGTDFLWKSDTVFDQDRKVIVGGEVYSIAYLVTPDVPGLPPVTQ